MLLNKLSVLNYKNIEELDVEFSPFINCFLGNNGMGKTNLLDAIYYLSFCKSHSNLTDTQNIRHEADFAVIQGLYQLDKPENFFCSIRRRQKKQFKHNKKEYDKLSDHIGLLPLIMVSPDDTEIINGASDERRKFMDIVISQFDKQYLHALIKYNKALQQRNALLKNDLIDDSLLELWDEQLIHEGQIIYQKRTEFIDNFIPTFKQLYAKICQTDEEIDLQYTSVFAGSDVRQIFLQKREKDKIIGHTTSGIHRDDIEMTLNGYPIKKIGSQGQRKTYLIALKLAQFEYLKIKGYTTPILLLDDIFDKLDANRVEQIINLVSDNKFGQIFITDTNKDHLDEILSKLDKDYRLFQVANGQIINTTLKENAV